MYCCNLILNLLQGKYLTSSKNKRMYKYRNYMQQKIGENLFYMENILI